MVKSRRDKSSTMFAFDKTLIKMFRLFLHFVSFFMFGYGCYYDWFYVHNLSIMDFEFAGKLKYLTFWNAILQTVYFFIALLNDVVGTNENKAKLPYIRRLKDYMFSALAFPSAIYVGATFWGLMSIDRELVFPKALDEFFPSWLNHLMHTNVVIFILIELYMTFRKYPSRKNGLTGMFTYLAAYLIWVHVIYYYSGRWVYPILEVLNWPSKVVFYLISVFFGLALYLLGEILNNKLWSKQLSQIKKSGKKKPN